MSNCQCPKCFVIGPGRLTKDKFDSLKPRCTATTQNANDSDGQNPAVVRRWARAWKKSAKLHAWMSNNHRCRRNEALGELERAEGRERQLRDELEEQARLVGKGTQREASLEAEVARLREALQWYADESVHQRPNNRTSRAQMDNGERARRALMQRGAKL